MNSSQRVLSRTIYYKYCKRRKFRGFGIFQDYCRREFKTSEWYNAKRKIQPEELPIFQYATSKSKRAVRVYIWGNAVSGCLGIPTFLRPPPGCHRQLVNHKPTKLTFAEIYKVFDVSCGHGFTVFAVKSNLTEEKLFGTGLNTYTQIGYQAVRKDHPLSLIIQPVPINLPLLPKTKIINIACGHAHTIVVTDKEGIFSLGNNSFGQCGYPIVEDEIYFGKKQINKVRGVDNITHAICGEDQTIFLNSKGEVFGCGLGNKGQTGLGHYQNTGVPTQLKGDIEGEKIVHVSGASNTMLAISENGDLFGWGNSEFGQLKVTKCDENFLNVPRHIPLPSIGKVICAAAGKSMCAIVNEQGKLYVWGYGLLGKGPQVSFLDIPTLLPDALFGKNEFNPDSKVKSVSSGLYHFAAITNQGHLYMWGENQGACLGLGHRNDQYFPFRVSVPAEVSKISCGIDHNAVLCRAFC
ncbi:RCC1-like G exchanging factor-like protein [Centruroides vittatus]|uniref:RCC1-like G exchanging factor-like protein n=1 Tax=Centruroides vittatus TaxID=120091 RepID=UPI00350EF616